MKRMHTESRPWISASASWKSLLLMVVVIAAGPGFLLALLGGSEPVMAQEYIRDQEPVPDSVDQVVTPMELSFQQRSLRSRGSSHG